MRGKSGIVAKWRAAEWLRDVAALLAIVVCFYSVISAIAPAVALAAPEICAPQTASGPAAPDTRTHASPTCLLCLPGCAAVAVAAPAPAVAPYDFPRDRVECPAASSAPATQDDSPHRPRGPPAI